jgi:hypothetical protein
VQAQQPETKQKCAERIRILYVPLSIVRCLGALFPSAEYHNLLHFVHKLLHPALTASKSCLLFTNRLQTVADRKKLKIQCPGVPPPFPYKLGGQNTANVDADTRTADRRTVSAVGPVNFSGR